MKKIVFLLIFTLLITGSVFAQTGDETPAPGSTADTDNLTVKLRVEPVNDVEWFMEGPIETEEEWNTASNDDNNNEDTKDFGSSSTIKVYPSILTNSNGPVTIKVKGYPLQNGDSTIDLTASFGSEEEAVTWTSEDAGTYIEISETDVTEYKRRVFSPALTLSLPKDWQASPGYNTPYQSTLTLEYSTQ